MRSGVSELRRPIRWGRVGGGAASNIGYSHRSAALRDRNFELLAGAFDVDAERGRAFGLQLGVAPDRCYATNREATDKNNSARLSNLRYAAPQAALRFRPPSRWTRRCARPSVAAATRGAISATRAFTVPMSARSAARVCASTLTASVSAFA